MKIILTSITFLLLIACQPKPEPIVDTVNEENHNELSLEKANYLSKLPLKCINNAYPYKAGNTIMGSGESFDHVNTHPSFYGCFDWHSAVHGHWSLVYLLKQFPELENRDSILQVLKVNLSKENIEKEIEYFTLNKYTKNFERPYGWAWILKLALELQQWDIPEAQTLYSNIKPLADLLIDKYEEYLPNLLYPIRVGEHSNTGFGLSFAYDYAVHNDMGDFISIIKERCMHYFLSDTDCPIHYEPSGYDFLSPCLEEADIMRRVLDEEQFKIWFEKFLPALATQGNSSLTPADVKDRSDGKLVHLDGLNFSRAWVLYCIADQYPEYGHLKTIASEHFNYSFDKIADGDYAGEHWLASFALYALQCSER